MAVSDISEIESQVWVVRNSDDQRQLTLTICLTKIILGFFSNTERDND